MFRVLTTVNLLLPHPIYTSIVLFNDMYNFQQKYIHLYMGEIMGIRGEVTNHMGKAIVSDIVH